MPLIPLPMKPKPPVAGQVALCRWGGDEFFATFDSVDQDWPTERYLMIARNNTPRFHSGTEIHVLETEISGWYSDAPPPEPAKFVAPPEST